MCSSLKVYDKETDAQLDIQLENSEQNCENKLYPPRVDGEGAAKPDSLEYNVTHTDKSLCKQSERLVVLSFLWQMLNKVCIRQRKGRSVQNIQMQHIVQDLLASKTHCKQC